MAWGALVLAGLFEVGWAVGLEYPEGFTRLWPRPTAGTIASIVLGVGLLGVAMKSLPMGTAYVIWAGEILRSKGAFARLREKMCAYGRLECSGNRDPGVTASRGTPVRRTSFSVIL
jgi:hypothetical protein